MKELVTQYENYELKNSLYEDLVGLAVVVVAGKQIRRPTHTKT